MSSRGDDLAQPIELLLLLVENKNENKRVLSLVAHLFSFSKTLTSLLENHDWG